VAVKLGRYHHIKKKEASSAPLSLLRLEETASKVGISVETLERWVEEKKGRTSEQGSRRVLRKILGDVERSRGKNSPNKSRP
jgi:hypothetical protein